MEKGKYGINIAFYGVAGFVFAMFGWTTALILLAGFVIVAEKNEWATRQVIQAICLCFVGSILSAVFGLLSFLGWIGGFYTIWSRMQTVIYDLADILVYVLCFLAIAKNAKGKEAGIPLADRFANWAFGKVMVIAQPVYAQPVQQPVQPAAPAAEAQPAADVCSKCGAPLNGAAFCTKCGTPANKQ